MNVSGSRAAAAWRQFVKDARGEEARLIIVHDELELAPGQVKVKSRSASAKGHNGLKSINEVLRGVDYTMIGVEIGRSESRDPDVVAGYVLRKMSAQERMKVEGVWGGLRGERKIITTQHKWFHRTARYDEVPSSSRSLRVPPRVSDM